MDVRANDELRALRERAYGPDADIHLDPVAQARLRELEAATPIPEAGSPQIPDAAAPSNPDAAPPPSADAAAAPSPMIWDEPRSTWDAQPDPRDAERSAADPGPQPAGEHAPRASETDAADPPDDDVPRRRTTLSRRTIWLWAASVVLALVVGAAITMTTSSFSGDRVAVLPEVDVTEWPTNMFGDPQEGARVFDVFEGTRILVVPNAWGSPDSQVLCLFVVRAEAEDGSDAGNEILTTGCGGTEFPPTASFTVTERSPAALRDRFPVGTGVRVTIEGDEVQVFARTP